MLQTFLIVLGFIGVSVVLMSVGVIFSNLRIKGSCGGLNKVTGDDCMFCDSSDESECKNPIVKIKSYIPQAKSFVLNKSDPNDYHKCKHDEGNPNNTCKSHT